ncbi:HAMP domain-containing protein, partial [Methylobacterium sp. A54F]
EVDAARRAGLLAVALAIVAALGAMMFGWLRVSRPVQGMTSAMQRLAGGDAAVAIPASGRRDEIGAMAAAVEVFKDNLIRTRRPEEETAQARQAAEEQRKIGMRQMAD